MVKISPNWQYNLSTDAAEGAGDVSRSVNAVAIFLLALVKVGHNPSSLLMAGATPLA
jgi:hypothetical protein